MAALIVDSTVILIRDSLVAILLAVYVYVVIRFLARKHYEVLSARYGDPLLARYLTRKFVHIAGAGPATLIAPLAFSEPFIPAVLALLLAYMLNKAHARGNWYYWFQEEGNRSEVVFVVSWAASILLLWYISPWLAFFPAFALSVGDGVTGYVRGLRHGRRVKSWEGTLAMMVAVMIPGYMVIGTAGVIAAIAASLAERLQVIDDNISIPLVSIFVLSLLLAIGLA